MSTSILKALPGKLDIKRHSPCILYIYFQEKVVVGIRVIQYKNPTESARRCQVENTGTGKCIPKIRIEIMNQR